ncbi:hypothetical protein [Gemella sp. zg-570]|nr:hypothetical protein [Gemella sp. zg-570]
MKKWDEKIDEIKDFIDKLVLLVLSLGTLASLIKWIIQTLLK